MSHDPKLSNHSSFFGDNFTTPEQDHGASLEELEPIVRMAYSASAEVILCVTCVIPSSVDQGGWSEDEIRVFGDRCTVAFLSVEMPAKMVESQEICRPLYRSSNTRISSSDRHPGSTELGTDSKQLKLAPSSDKDAVLVKPFGYAGRDHRYDVSADWRLKSLIQDGVRVATWGQSELIRVRSKLCRPGMAV